MNIEEYAKKHKHYLKDQMPDELDMLFKNNTFDKVIDLGCGGGLILYSIYKREYNKKIKEIWGVDLSAERLKGIKEISDEIKTVQDDAQTLENIPSDNFDLTVSTQVIEHVPDDGKMIDSLYRITKKGGFIYIDTVFKKKWAWYFYKNQIGKYSLDPTHIREYQSETELFDKISSDKFETIFSKKELIAFPLINFVVRRLKIQNAKVHENPILKCLAMIKIPVPGYYCWKILVKKK
jgi:ubiquinone/menaquinone biosynthesis C-methylase UbiE